MRRTSSAPTGFFLPLCLFVPLVMCVMLALSVTSALATPGPGWSIQAIAQPTNLSPTGSDGYTLIVTNVGSQPSRENEPVTIADTLPAGVQATRISGEEEGTGATLGCGTAPLQCVGGMVPAGGVIVVRIGVTVEEAAEAPGALNVASVSGGGAPAVTTSERATFDTEPASFGIADFSLQAFGENGFPSTQAGGHPYTLATSLYFTSDELAGSPAPAGEVKDIIVNLPLGIVGNPQARPKCPLWALLQETNLTACPPASRIGTVLFEAEPNDTFRVSEGPPSSQTTAVYNMQPEAGFPAEFGFTFLGKVVYMYASAVRIGGQLRLRVTIPGVPELETNGATLLFFGDPGEHFKEASSPVPFFTNPADCEAGPLSATVEADSWGNPSNRRGNVYSAYAEATTYPQLSGCNMLQFQPTLAVKPDTTQADEPSGYAFTVASPQSESPLTPGTPPLRSATVTLPPGVSLSPSAAEGLRACAATGSEGINIGDGQATREGLPEGGDVPGAGEDVGDEEATELGAGHLEGNSSPYDDGLYHTAPGHCPKASTIATVEVETPLLPNPLEGHLYVAQPGCGGSGQPRCTSEDARNGTLFGVYLEAAGSGTIVKLAGSASVNPTTGQVTATFRETPQVPFNSLRLHFTGGPRAPLANPQACGPATTAAVFSAWSSSATLDSQAFAPFTVDWNDAGGPCPATLPLTPSLVAETLDSTAGAFSPFSFTLSRGDRQQYFSQLSVTTPPGLLAMISSVPLCGEPQAALGTCAAASEIGTATVAAGAGSQPFWVTGNVYLTSGYNGAPFGLSVVVPARAGPFNLGDVVVRSAITVNPETSAVTITSDPLPQIIDGIPLRVQTINVNVNLPDFMFNPTNCGEKQVAVTVLGTQGALAHMSSPFAASGCRNLSFSPSFKVSTRARTSKANGAALDVKVASKLWQANIRAVAVTLPKQLPARLTTIQQACLAATFEANPAACPAGSEIGFVQAHTPVLPVLLSGPAYLVSHGGAAFPDVIVILQGEGVRLDLTGSINIAKGGITSSTFANVPDAPVTSFEFNLPEGSHSALATNLPAKTKGDFCGTTLLMPTIILGQNGVRIKQNTKVTVSGCPKPKKKKKTSARAQGNRQHKRSRR
jgi:hypothetical protein